MPTYEYACKSCGTHIDVVQSFTDDALTTCESCGGDLRKVFGAVGISFKGSGFYKNDNRSQSSPGDSASKSDGESKPSESKPSQSGETKTDTKKSETKSSDTAKAS